MAEKILATITLVRDDESNDVTFTTHEIPGTDYKIVINAIEDVKNGAQANDTTAIVAHELGHVLSDLFGAGKKWHERMGKVLARTPLPPQAALDVIQRMPGYDATVLPEEREAWMYADKMLGDKTIRRDLIKMALGGYERAAQRTGPASKFDLLMKRFELE